MVLEALTAFVVGLLVGGLGIYVGGRIITGENDYGHAVMSALVGAIIWAIAAFFLEFIPVIGPLLVLIAWIWVINLRYPESWVSASLIGLIAWLTVIFALIILASLGIGGLGVIGVPV